MPVIPPRPGILDIVPYVPGNVDTVDPEKMIYLASNESPLGPSPRAIAAFNACAKTLHRYPDGASAQLRQAIAEKYAIEPLQIVCGAGSERLIDLLARAYAGPEDEVLYSQYGFIMYPICTLAAGAKPVTAAESEYAADVDNLLAAVTERTRIVFIANPNNPTGTYLSADEIRRLRESLPASVLLVIDSAYAEYVDAADYSAGHELVNTGADNVVVLHTFSKIYGLAAVRLGWAFCPADIADVLNRIRGSFNITAPAQAAGVAALEDSEHILQAKQHNAKWLPWMQNALNEIGLKTVPSVANFILTRFPNIESCQAAQQHLQELGVIVRPVGGYGLADCLRITIGTQQQNLQCVEALQTFVVDD